MLLSRRQMVEGGLAAGAGLLAARPAHAAAPAPLPHIHPGQPVVLPARAVPLQARAAPPAVPARPRVMVDASVNPRLVAQARAAFDRHRPQVRTADVVGIVDFSRSSRDPRFYLLDTNTGRVTQHHVSHGRGSDPGHTGWLQHFSNRHGSLASSDGAYVTTEIYHGRYGRSMRVRGLDHTNSNAEARAIVIHPAWYAEPSHLAAHGVLGRSEGCFALSSNSLVETVARLGPGRFLYASRA